MAIEFDCPSCGGTLQVGDESAGRVIRCGGCMTALRVPGGGAATAPEPPPPPNPYGGQSYPPPPARRSTAEATNEEPPPAAKPVSPRRRDRDRDDEYDRRERRSRRRPSAPAGKGVFFWLVIIGAVMLAGVVACCGGLFMIAPDTKWQDHKSADGGFKVELPAKPHPNIAKDTNMRLENGTRAEGTVLLRRGAVKFVVLYRDIPPTKGRATTDEQELEERVMKLQKGMKVERPGPGVAITWEGFPAREIEFFAETGWHKARVIVADSRVYIVLAGGGLAQPGDPDVHKFLDSFKITEEKLVQEGERRDNQAKLAAEALKAAKEREAKRRAEEEIQQRHEAEERKAREVAEAEFIRVLAITAAETVMTAAQKSEPKPPPPPPVRPQLPVAPLPRAVGK